MMHIKTEQKKQDEKVVPCTVYVKNNAEVTVLSWRVPDYSKLLCNVVYDKHFQNFNFKCIFKLFKTSEKLYLCVCIDKLCQKVVEFQVVNEVGEASLTCFAEEIAEGCYVGEFQHELFAGPESNYLRNGVLTVSIKYCSSSKSVYGQEFLPEKAEFISDISELCFDLRESFLNGLHTDFLIHIQNYTFKAHKFILAARSKYFDHFFQKEDNPHEISIDDNISPCVMHEVLLYMYSGELKGSSLEYMLNVSYLALKYQIDTLTNHCSRYFEKCIHGHKATKFQKATTQPVQNGPDKQSEFDINCIRIILNAAFKSEEYIKILDVKNLVENYAKFLERYMSRFQYLPTRASATEYEKLTFSCIVSLWKLSYKTKMSNLQQICTKILERCIADNLWFDDFIMTGRRMDVELESVISVCEFAHNLKLQILRNKCSTYLEKHIDAENSMQVPAARVQSQRKLSMGCASRLFKMVCRVKVNALIHRCSKYFLEYLRTYSSSNEYYKSLEKMEILVKIFELSRKYRIDNLKQECIAYFKNILLSLLKLEMPENAPSEYARIFLIKYVEKLYTLSLLVPANDLKDTCLSLIEKYIVHSNRPIVVEDQICRDIDCIKAIFKLAHEQKLIELKKSCISCFEKRIHECDSFVMKGVLSEKTLTAITGIFKLACKVKISELRESFIDFLNKQIIQYADISRRVFTNEKWEFFIAMCNIVHKQKLREFSGMCISRLTERLEQLESDTSFATELVQFVSKIYKLGHKLMTEAEKLSEIKSPLKNNSKSYETDEETKHQQIAIARMLSICHTYLAQGLNTKIDRKINLKEVPESEKLKIMECIVEVCDLSCRQYSKQSTEFERLKHFLSFECLRFIALNIGNEPFKEHMEMSKNLNVGFILKVYSLADKLQRIIGEKVKIGYDFQKELVKDETRKLNSQSNIDYSKIQLDLASQIQSFCRDSLLKIPDIGVFETPDSKMQRNNAECVMKVIGFTCDTDQDRRRIRIGLIKTFKKCLPSESVTPVPVKNEEMQLNLNLEDMSKICRFAYLCKKQSLQNESIRFICRLMNENNYKDIYKLGDEIKSSSLKETVKNFLIDKGIKHDFGI